MPARKRAFNFTCYTHYQRLLDHVRPDVVHVLKDGKIVKTGGFELVKQLESEGYAWLNQEDA